PCPPARNPSLSDRNGALFHLHYGPACRSEAMLPVVCYRYAAAAGAGETTTDEVCCWGSHGERTGQRWRGETGVSRAPSNGSR
ncbi:MAG: hypothetical protein M3380_10915, partial [Chloroflexota bacterium]|nr:hypothetical protein [Chloroflexota bacterium]